MSGALPAVGEVEEVMLKPTLIAATNFAFLRTAGVVAPAGFRVQLRPGVGCVLTHCLVLISGLCSTLCEQNRGFAGNRTATDRPATSRPAEEWHRQPKQRMQQRQQGTCELELLRALSCVQLRQDPTVPPLNRTH